MNVMIPMYVHSTNFIDDRVNAIKEHYADRDRGANLIEYAGLIVLAAFIIGLIFAAVKAVHLNTKLSTAVSKIFSPEK